MEEKNAKVIDGEEVFNRRQRRYLKTQMIKQEKTKQKRLIEKGEQYITRKEFVGLFQSCQKLRDRLYYLDINFMALEKLLLQKGIFSAEELQKAVNVEVERTQEFSKVQSGEKDYDARLSKCVELEVNPDVTIIGQQILNDTELSFEEKYELASKYNLTTLIKILDNQKNK
ncbi:MAG: hypothetical protein PHD05_00580 [Sphaerochaetaceae bacterium]|jgi:hypothetical protein|nr:hypothetical protein [Sphaerochaetaceae bacterium]